MNIPETELDFEVIIFFLFFRLWNMLNRSDIDSEGKGEPEG